jgi:hypothetical protein
MEIMHNFIGGLFRNREDAEKAREALRENGLDEKSINMLQCTHEKEAVLLDRNPPIKSIGKSALTGALVLGGIGAGIGLLIGLGVIPFPGLEPSGGETLPFQITWQLIFASTAAGAFLGAWTGGIVGAAIRLAMPHYYKVDTPQEANKGDLMLAVQADDTERGSKARSIMEKNGALRFEEFKDSWDSEIWSVLNQETPQVR